jgi:mannosyltransferase
MWFDEVASWLQSKGIDWFDQKASWLDAKATLAEVISATARDNYPPLHNLLLFVSMNVSGSDTEWVLRLPSALLGIANMAAIYWVGTLIGGRVAGLFAAAMLAVSSMHIYYSQEARMYSLMALAATLYAASAFFFAKSPTTPRAALLALCGLALVYSHPFGTLNWVAIAIGISGHILLTSDFPRRGLVRWMSANAAIAIGFLPWALILLRRAQAIAGNFWPPYPSADYVYEVLLGIFGGSAAGAALLAAAAIGFCCNPRAFWVLLVWTIGPIAAALIVSLTSTHIVVGRYLIGGLPALVTLAALGMTHLARHPRWAIRIMAPALLATVAVANLTNVPAPRTDWRTVAAHLHERVQETDCVLVYPSFNWAALRYYLRRPFCAVLAGSISTVDIQSMAANRLFVVLLSGSLNLQEASLLQDKLNAFGREAQRVNVRDLSIVEYGRQR